MNTYKLRGSGPLAGMVAYGTIAHVLEDDAIVLDMDEPHHIGGREFRQVTVCAVHGTMRLDSQTETDLVRVDKPDLIGLWNEYVERVSLEPLRSAA